MEQKTIQELEEQLKKKDKELQHEREEFKKKEQKKDKRLHDLAEKEFIKSNKIVELEHQIAIIKQRPDGISLDPAKLEEAARLEIIREQTASKPKLDSFQQASIKLIADSIPFQINVPAGDYIKKDGEFTYTSTDFNAKTFPISPAITKGIYRFETKINKRGDVGVGVMKSGLNIPFGDWPGGKPQNQDCMIFYFNGYVYQCGIGSQGNARFLDNSNVTIELNMDSRPRTAHLFLRGILQKLYISDLPESVQLYFYINFKDDSISALSLKQLAAPTTVKVSGAKEVKWI
ncbi:MAG: hypothetical protein EZS28_001631 [Streblomastix strix]|uniref:SPRY domain-containing protein n=1 Tax=Streblomastix strix TaxID=222440 RepID=A0A5J4X6P3_9EUKA|nr:MAG: hypothetical protein EZS28_001631 [Streblomastix strix]